MSVPDWVQDSVFYQIFPDRFANGDPTNDPANVRPWGEKPDIWGFQGGDLQGILQRFDYLLDLGVNAVYLNPIFLAPSNHRYNATDYFHIDPKLGNLQDFQALIERAHAHDVRIILDGVFNHCGRGFFAFTDILENSEHSPYLDWFHVQKLPLNAYQPNKPFNYLAWWNIQSLPKFNSANPETRRYLLSVARHWIELGADGWRLDVPNEIDDDHFWAEFRNTVKDVNPEAYLVGEIWDINPRWVGAEHFDGLMNYPLRDAVLDFLAKGLTKPSAFSQQIQTLLDSYPRQHTYCHYVPLGTHDTERLRTMCAGDLRRVRQALLVQFGYPGAPAIYYGDEIGLEGGKDPDCRRAFPGDENMWDHALRDFVKSLIRLRKQLPELRRGDYKTLVMDDDAGIYAFCRRLDGQSTAIVLNASDREHHVDLPVSDLGWDEGWKVYEALGSEELTVSSAGLGVHMAARGGALITLPR